MCILLNLLYNAVGDGSYDLWVVIGAVSAGPHQWQALRSTTTLYIITPLTPNKVAWCNTQPDIAKGKSNDVAGNRDRWLPS